MRSASGPQWVVMHDVPYELNFLSWWRRNKEPAPSLSTQEWENWEDRLVAKEDLTMLPAVEATAPSSDLIGPCRQAWPLFTTTWEPHRRALERRIYEVATACGARLNPIMGQSNRRISLLQVNEPGDLCRRIGNAWVWPCSVRRTPIF